MANSRWKWHLRFNQISGFRILQNMCDTKAWLFVSSSNMEKLVLIKLLLHVYDLWMPPLKMMSIRFDRIHFAFENHSRTFIHHHKEEMYIKGEIYWLFYAFPLCQLFSCLFMFAVFAMFCVFFMFVVCWMLNKLWMWMHSNCWTFMQMNFML